jgi:hypothetical protein
MTENLFVRTHEEHAAMMSTETSRHPWWRRIRRRLSKGKDSGVFPFVPMSVAGVLLCSGAAIAQMSHDHASKTNPTCGDARLACATKATPTFAPDGTLWVAWDAGGKVSVAHSSDLGRSFSTAVSVNPEPLDLDWGPDARPNIAVDRDGRVFVAFARFKDREFNGQVLYSRSTDGGQTFAPPTPITTNMESQRFEGIALDSDGSLFTAWLDKRNRVPAKAQNEKYVGAGLAFAWVSDHGTTVSDSRIAHDNTCECCQLGIAFAGTGRPVIAFRNVFDGTVRDPAVIAFSDPQTPGPLYRVSVDDWKTDACPHHGPSLAISADGTYHVTWFTNGRVRKGLFYAHSSDGGRTFSEPMPLGQPDRNPSHPYVLATKVSLWVAWKEFDGEDTTIPVMESRDNGRTWSSPKVVARTADTSDHPLLVTSGKDAFLSWQTQIEGYRMIHLENVP